VEAYDGKILYPVQRKNPKGIFAHRQSGGMTKEDKADQKEKEKTIKELSLLSKAPIVITSAKEGKGKKELLKFLKVE
jgi:ethanolamine utilization protein EutP (predicted NTPase)